MSAAAFGYEIAAPQDVDGGGNSDSSGGGGSGGGGAAPAAVVVQHTPTRTEQAGLMGSLGEAELRRLQLENEELKAAVAKAAAEAEEARAGFEQQIVRLTTLVRAAQPVHPIGLLWSTGILPAPPCNTAVAAGDKEHPLVPAVETMHPLCTATNWTVLDFSVGPRRVSAGVLLLLPLLLLTACATLVS